MSYTRRQREKQVFENFLFECVTRPDLSGDLLTNHLNSLYSYSIFHRNILIHECFVISNRTRGQKVQVPHKDQQCVSDGNHACRYSSLLLLLQH